MTKMLAVLVAATFALGSVTGYAATDSKTATPAATSAATTATTPKATAPKAKKQQSKKVKVTRSHAKKARPAA